MKGLGCVNESIVVKGVTPENNNVDGNGLQRSQATGKLAAAATYLHMMLAAQGTAQQLRLSLI